MDVLCARRSVLLSFKAAVQYTPVCARCIALIHHLCSHIIHYLSRSGWVDRMIEGNMQGTAAGLLEECVLDDDDGKCQKFSDALEKLDKLLGVGAGEQY